MNSPAYEQLVDETRVQAPGTVSVPGNLRNLENLFFPCSFSYVFDHVNEAALEKFKDFFPFISQSSDSFFRFSTSMDPFEMRKREKT